MTETHEEVHWIPMRTTEKGRHYFWQNGVRSRRTDAKDDFAKYCCIDWKVLKKEGWRVVRVRLIAWP